MGHTNTQPGVKSLSGVVGFFKQPHDLVVAAEKIRQAGYKFFDAYSPFPVHGLDKASGIKRSFLPYVTFAAGATGATLGFGLQYWTSAVDWPLIVGGKPFNSWPAFVPVTFEFTVLLAALSTVGAMFIANGLPNMTKRAFDPGITNDKFAMVIEVPPAHDETDSEEVAKVGKKFVEAEAQEFLKKLGAYEVKSVYNEGWFS